jgi:hypothetical protein
MEVRADLVYIASLSKDLQQAITDGNIGVATTDLSYGTTAQMETAAATASDAARWWNTDHKIEYMFVGKRWIPFGTPDFRYGGVKFDDFDSPAGTGQLGWTAVGTASASNGDSSHVGVIALRTTAASTRSAISLRSTAIAPGGSAEHNFEVIFRVPTLATATEDFVVTLGLNDNNAFDSNGHATDGIYFSYNRAVNGANLQLVTAQGGTRTTTNTSQALSANTWYCLWCKVKSNTSAEFFFWTGSAWTSLGTHTTNIPTGSNLTGFQLKVDRTATAASPSLGFDVDEFYHWYAFGGSRV